MGKCASAPNNARISVRYSASDSSLFEHERGRNIFTSCAKKMPTAIILPLRHGCGSARLVIPGRLLQRPPFLKDATPSLHTRGSSQASSTAGALAWLDIGVVGLRVALGMGTCPLISTYYIVLLL